MLKTAQKISLARLASLGIRGARATLGLGDRVAVRRRGINWLLDLREGVDFSIYLLGGFELSAVRAYQRIVKPGDTVVDIGANIGAHTLPLAQAVGETGLVVACEPTAFAFDKLLKNIQVNPGLSDRIRPLQMMLVSSSSDNLAPEVYSSWPLVKARELHEKHLGRLTSTQGGVASTLDDAVTHLGLKSIDFIKLDVDGNELPVLQGGQSALNEFKPTIIMELCPYVHGEHGYSFRELVDLLGRAGYSFHRLNDMRELPGNAEKLKAMIPDGAGVNVVLFPR